MSILCQLRTKSLAPFLIFRQYSQKPLKTKAHNKMATKQIHKEIMKYIDRYASITIRSDIFLKVRAADVHRYPNADVIVAEIHGGHSKNCSSIVDLRIETSEDEKEIDVQVLQKQASNGNEFHCELAVPVKSALFIEARESINVEHMLGAEISVHAGRNIKTRELRCEKITLKSQKGNINCAGMLLGQKTVLETKQKGCILLDKLQGDHLKCSTEAGDVHVNCSYVEDSTFETQTGCMELKNVHKRSNIFVYKQEGSLNMTGVDGNINIKTNGRNLELQLSKLYDENQIIAENLDSATINISEEIEKNTELNLNAKRINLNENLQHLSRGLDQQSKSLKHQPTKDSSFGSSKLTVQSPEGNIQLGKLSWGEMMYSTMNPSSSNKKS